MKGPRRWGGPSGLAWLLPANKQGLLNCEGPGWSKTCHQLYPGSKETLKIQSRSGERRHNWSHSATFRLASALHFPYKTPLREAGDRLGAQSKSTTLPRCCVAHVLQQMGLGWREKSLITSVRQPGWQGRAPDRKLAELEAHLPS